MKHVEGWILHRADGLIVVNKPVGMPTAGDHLDQPGSVQFALMQHFRRRRIWAVHQLDRDTTGVNLFVRRKALVAEWTTHLKQGTKTYLAVVNGRLTDARTIDAPIGWIAAERRRGVTTDGKAARSHVRPLSIGDDATLVAVAIETGRTHQVRVHLKHIDHPLVGDVRYAAPEDPIARPALHAWRVEAGGKSFVAPVPQDLAGLCDRHDLTVTGASAPS